MTLWIRILYLSCIASFCILCPSPGVPPAGAAQPPGYVEVWADEFNGTTLDTNKWGHTRPGYPRGGRIAIQSTDAVSVSGGNLVIRTYSDAVDPNDPDPPPMQHYTGMIQSGVATTEGECQMPPDELVPPGNKYKPLYGYIEASIDFDGASGMWHSFFMNTPNNLLQGPLDEHLRGMEMDIVEHKKMEGFTNVETGAPTAIHWMTGTSPSICYPNTPSFLSAGGGPHSGNGSLATGFHTYGLEWTPDYLRFYYDNNVVWRVNNSAPCPVGWPCVIAPVSHVPEIILLCGEVPPPSFNAYGYIPPLGYGVLGASSNPKMTVAYVRHYQLVAPGPVTLSVPSVGQTTMAVSWNAPGNDGYTGTATEYDLRYSAGPIDAASFGSATRVIIAAPAPAGSPECHLVDGLSPGTTYYFALKTRDESGNWSEVSNNSPSGTTVTQNWFAECSGGNPAAKLPVPSEEAPRMFSAPRPNPAHGATSFRISVPSESRGAKLRVGVYDVAGRRVRSLVERAASPGPAQIEWNLLNDSGHRVASGLYMVRVDIGNTRETFRLVVVR